MQQYKTGDKGDKFMTDEQKNELLDHIGRKADMIIRLLDKIMDVSDMEEYVYKDIFQMGLCEADVTELSGIKDAELYHLHEVIDCYGKF